MYPELEKKLKNTITTRDYARYWFTTNQEHGLKIDNSDKNHRHFVTKTVDPFKSDKGGKEHFDKLHKDFPDSNAANHFFTFLVRRDTSEDTFNPRFAPNTDGRMEQELLSMDRMDQCLYDQMQTWRAVNQLDVTIKVSDLYAKFLEWREKSRLQDHLTSVQALGARVKSKRNIFISEWNSGRKKDPVRYRMKIAENYVNKHIIYYSVVSAW